MTSTLPPRAPEQGGPPPRRGRPPRLPAIPGPLQTAVAGWRVLRRMSTALVLLLALAVASLIATFVPQEPVIGTTVAQWRDGTAGPGEAVAAVFDWLQLFDVFGSWWFAALVVLLFVSLTGCLVPRWRIWWRNARRAPARGRNLERLTHHVVWEVDADADADALLDRAAAVLRSRRGLPAYRVRRTTGPDGTPQLAAERGHTRELGSLVFHTSFYVLLVGIVLASAFSFTGQVDRVEGQSFADTPLGYDAQVPGRFWDTDDHRGFVTRVDDFTVTYTGPDGFTPDEFVSTVTFIEDGREVATEEIRVNHPARHAGLTYYQRAFGFAPHVRIAPPGSDEPLFDQEMVLRQDGGFWWGRGKVTFGTADLPVQMGLEVVFLPDADIDADGNVTFSSPEPRDPRLLAALYVAEDLGLDRTVPVTSLEWPEEALVEQVMLTPGTTAPVLGGLLEIAFDDLAMWTGLQVSHQPYRWLILTAAALLLAGLLPSLYAYRRRLWVEVRPGRVVVAGVALQRRSRFAEEFEALTGRLKIALTRST